MQLQRLAALERQQIEAEHKELKATIKELEGLLASKAKIRKVVGEELGEMVEKYGDERSTSVQTEELGKFGDLDLIPKEEIIVSLSAENYVKRMPATTYKTQGRGGKGVIGAKTTAEDVVNHLVTTDTHTPVLFFTNQGRVFSLKAHQIPAASRQARGTAIVNVLQLAPDEKVTALVPVTDFSDKDCFLFMATKGGFVKKTPLSDFEKVRASGLIAIRLGKGDELAWVRVTSGKDDVLMVTAGGKAIRFAEKEVRPMGRPARGVSGMRVAKGDQLVGMSVVEEGVDLLTVSEQGLGKRTKITDYPTHHRNVSGVKTANVTAKTGPLVTARAIRPEHKGLLFSSQSGQVIRIDVSDVPQLSRATQGLRLMRLGEGDTLVAVATV